MLPANCTIDSRHPPRRGECQTFGPGDYATLPAELNKRISSRRSISNNNLHQRRSTADRPLNAALADRGALVLRPLAFKPR